MEQYIVDKYNTYCTLMKIPHKMETSILSYDDSTLFCPAGMQQFKSKFDDVTYKDTLCNIQPCLRLNDLDEIGDGSHLLYFNMMGLFSFKELSVKDSIDFWMRFLQFINLKVDYVTIHPDRKEWSEYYKEYDVTVKYDTECTWSDGNIKGYCTEFYKDDIEIGNIVNPLGHSIDCGFGLERISMVLSKQPKTDVDTLRETVEKIIDSGIKPSNLKQGYILRKLLRICWDKNIIIDHEYYNQEVIRQEKVSERYEKLKHKNKDKSKEWWWDTHGIDIDSL